MRYLARPLAVALTAALTLAASACDGPASAPAADDVAADTALADIVADPDADAASAEDGGLADAGDGLAPDSADTASDLPDLADVADGPDAADSAADSADASPPPPPLLTLTVARIPAEMNGASGWSDIFGANHPFTLRVNRAYTTLDVLADRRHGGPVDWATLSVSCSVDGAPWAPGVFLPAADGASASRAFSAADPLPDGVRLSCVAGASGPGGAATPSALTFDAATLPPELDPFATEDIWLVVLSRDLFEITVEPGPGDTTRLVSRYLAAGNGVPDFVEPFYHLGLMHPDHPAAAATVRDHLLRTIRRHANAIFGLDAAGRPTPEGVPLRLYFEGDAGAPEPADFATGGFSMIALGGDGAPADQLQGTFGRALIDWNNQEREDDTVYGLGVFPTALVRAILAQPLGVYLLADLLPSEGGVPIGGDPNDALFIGVDADEVPSLPDDFTRLRAQLYAFGVDLGGLALASILTHEMGHSLGLVPFGPPCEGLFAGVDGPSFLASFAPDAHIDTAGLNIMQTGGSVDWTSALGEEPRFNPLNWAYLRRQLVVGPQP